MLLVKPFSSKFSSLLPLQFLRYFKGSPVKSASGFWVTEYETHADAHSLQTSALLTGAMSLCVRFPRKPVVSALPPTSEKQWSPFYSRAIQGPEA